MKRFLFVLVIFPAFLLAAESEVLDIAVLQTKAAEGDTAARFALGEAYYRAKGVERNWPEAVRWWRLAAEQGHLEAQKQLVHAYDAGNGVRVDQVEVVKWARLAAEQGDADSQAMLAGALANGMGSTRDMTEALKWYRRAGERGIAHCSFKVAEALAKGTGAPQDPVEAIKWYRIAAEQGHSVAQVVVGTMYSKGDRLPQDHAEALKWYLRAAQQGNQRARILAGNNYFNGDGAPRDYVEALAWYEVSGPRQDPNEFLAEYEAGMHRTFTLNPDPVDPELEKRRGKARKAVGREGIIASQKRSAEIVAFIEQNTTAQSLRAGFRVAREKTPELLDTFKPAPLVATNAQTDAVVATVPAGSDNTFGQFIKDLFNVKLVDTQPVARVQPAPVYPASMVRAGINGHAIVEFIISINGDVIDAHAVGSSSKEFEAPAVQAVMKWKFKPGRIGKHAVNVLASQRIVFDLDAK